MDSKSRKRVTMKLKHPNPLFVKWLTDWRDKAKEQDSKMQYTFGKALQSLRKYPLPLESGRDCKILKGFGERLCQMLDQKLRKHKMNVTNSDLSEQYQLNTDEEVKPKSKKVRKSSQKSSPNLNKAKQEYSPVYRSGAYAILVALYENSLQADFKGFMTKDDIVREGSHLCEKSFVTPDPGTYYTSWSSMKTLLDKNLVLKEGQPAKYTLTDEGIVKAHRLYRTNLTDEREREQVESKIEKLNNVMLREESGSVKSKVLICAESAGGSSALSDKSNNCKENLPDSDRFGADVMCSVNESRKGQKGRKKVLSGKPSTVSDVEMETLVFAPNTFDVYLAVDTHETSGNGKHLHDDALIMELTRMNVVFEVKHLKVGDYVWICRHRTTEVELVLPYVAERKRMDDFGSSIKDGRYHEQKFRLRQCGIQNVIYIVESYGDNLHTGLPLPTLLQAATNTTVHDYFHLKFTDNVRGTAQYLSCMTKILHNKYKSKTVMSCPKNNLQKTTIEDDLVPLLTFKEFNQGGAMHKKYTASQLFLRQLVQLRGVSVDKALAIVDKYPTPKLLSLAYQRNSADTSEKLLATITFGKNNKKIGPVISKTIYQLYK